MARGKNSRLARRGGDEEDWDDNESLGSIQSSSTAFGELSLTDEVQSVTQGDILIAISEALLEKRRATREKALEQLVNLLATRYCYAEVVSEVSLTHTLLGLIRRGGDKEIALACRALGLFCITLGLADGSDGLFEDALPILEKAAGASRCKDGSFGSAKPPSPTAQATAIETLAVLTFVACEQGETTDHVMAILTGLWSAGSSLARAAALRGWALLLTTVEVRRLSAGSVEASLARLSAILGDEDVDVRAAAGEAIALLYSTAGLEKMGEHAHSSSQAAERDHAEQEDSAISSSEEASSSGDEFRDGDAAEGGRSGAQFGGIMTQMRALAANRGGGPRRSKRDRAVQGQSFRNLVKLVEDGDVTTQTMRLKNKTVLQVDTLEGNTHLNAMRRYLAEGFQVHLQENPLLHQIFDFVPRAAEPERLSSLQKRLYRSPNDARSKCRTQNRDYGRSMKAAMRGGAYYE